MAAISAIRSSVIPNGVSLNNQDGSTEIIATNGQPLRIVGQVELSVSFATTDFNTQDKFLVVNDLPVAGILVSDFCPLMQPLSIMQIGVLLIYQIRSLTA